MKYSSDSREKIVRIRRNSRSEVQREPTKRSSVDSKVTSETVVVVAAVLIVAVAVVVVAAVVVAVVVAAVVVAVVVAEGARAKQFLERRGNKITTIARKSRTRFTDTSTSTL